MSLDDRHGPTIRRDLLRLERHQARVAGMLTDPDLTGDLLLIGLVIAHHIDVSGAPGADFWAILAGLLDGDTEGHVALDVITGDIPRPGTPGGVLARHIPEMDWPRLWRTLDPAWADAIATIPTLPPTGRPALRSVK